MKSFDGIPTLAFGQDRSIGYTDPERMSEALSPGGSQVMKHRAVRPDGAFGARTAVLKTRSSRSASTRATSPTPVCAAVSTGSSEVGRHRAFRRCPRVLERYAEVAHVDQGAASRADAVVVASLAGVQP